MNTAVFKNNVRVGTVTKFVGNRPNERWVAFGPNDTSKPFPTKREAVAWLSN